MYLPLSHEMTKQKMILRQTALLQGENHMALRIKEALKDNKKVLAVTGGFHSLGLYELLKSDNIQKEKPCSLKKMKAVSL